MPTPLKRLNTAYTIILVAGWLLILLIFTYTIQPNKIAHAGAADPTEKAPDPTPYQLSPRLIKPIVPANPTMADNGAVPYWAICLSCHGDKGQGLTDEWREAGFGEDMNCWKSKCHALNHPTPGFNFPRQVPAIIGAQTLQRFTTVDELEKYIKTTMPWWDPGSLSDQDAWNITAYLLRENGSLPNTANLNPKFASFEPVHLPIRQQEGENNWQYGLATFFGLASVFLIGKRVIDKNKLTVSKKALHPNFFHHLHPPTIPERQARWLYTLGAGGLAVFLTLIIIITGVLELFFYTPTPEQAGISIQIITFVLPFGALIRGLHFWSAQALVIVSGIHLLRVIFTGAFKPPKRYNYLIGLAVFILIIFLNFTGYILRWDNGIHWALIVGTNLLKTIPFFGIQLYEFIVGGDSPGFATLTRFYAWHIAGLSLATITLIGWHLFRVRRDGRVSTTDSENKATTIRINRFELARREVIAMLISISGLIFIATRFQAPLAAPILDASIPLNPDVRAPWFFLWVQQLLRFGNAFWMGVAIPLGILIILVCLPILPNKSNLEEKGKWFPKASRLATLIMAILAFTWVLLTMLELNK